MRKEEFHASERVFAGLCPRLVLVKSEADARVPNFVFDDGVGEMHFWIPLLDPVAELLETLEERNHGFVEAAVHEHTPDR